MALVWYQYGISMGTAMQLLGYNEKKSKKSHFFLDSNEFCCTFAVFYSTNTLQQNTTT